MSGSGKCYPRTVDETEFRGLVKEALAKLPDEFRKAMKNIEIVVEDAPTPRHNELFEKRGENWLLLGLYEGVPLNQRGTGYANVLPDKITLFKESIALHCGGDHEEMVVEIRRVFLHEVGHYFGLSDKRLRELGY